jgi:L-Ala-D/L-Glu epimerase
MVPNPTGREPLNNGVEIAADRITVCTSEPFAISRGTSTAFERVVLTLRADGLTGRGEAAPTARYDQDAPSSARALASVGISDPHDIEGTLLDNGHLPPASKAALDAALHDLAARRAGVPLYEFLGLPRPSPVSAYTLGIADPATTVERAKRLCGFPILKIKLGSHEDLATVRAVAEVSGGELWVDANEAFSPQEAPAVARELKDVGVRVIEQPTPASSGPEALRKVAEAASPVPVIADEGAVCVADVSRLAGYASGVNVKLAKCGGIRAAMEMVEAARARGMVPMLGCMVETSLGISAAAHVSGLFDLVDLDGAMLLADDPFVGVGYERGSITVPASPGLGVEPR